MKACGGCGGHKGEGLNEVEVWLLTGFTVWVWFCQHTVRRFNQPCDPVRSAGLRNVSRSEERQQVSIVIKVSELVRFLLKCSRLIPYEREHKAKSLF